MLDHKNKSAAAFLMALVTASRPSNLRKIELTTDRVSSLSYRFDCIELKEYKIAIAHSASTNKNIHILAPVLIYLTFVFFQQFIL